MLNLNLKSDFAIFELGTNNFLEIKKLTTLIMPSQAIITNIFPTHLEKLINTRNIAKEKSDIFNIKFNPNINLMKGFYPYTSYETMSYWGNNKKLIKNLNEKK